MGCVRQGKADAKKSITNKRYIEEIVANIFIFYLTLMLTTVLKTELAELFTLLTAFTL